jgi:hypothetical protein
VVGLPGRGWVPRVAWPKYQNSYTMANCHASVELARKVWSPTSERNLFRAFMPDAHFHLKRIAADFYPKVF